MESIATAIAEAHAAARVRWPELTVELAQFSDEITRRLGGEPEAIQLATICTDDVYLAIACINGDSAAIDQVERDYLVEVADAARKMDATDAQIAEVGGQLRQILLPGEPGQTSALAEFTGRGDLRGYLRGIATRELARAIDRGLREQSIEPLLDHLDMSKATELGPLYEQHGAEIAAALRAALEVLDERHRIFLRYGLVAGWSIDRIGELYGVHRSTTARWLTTARDALADQLRRQITARLAIPLEDVYSIVREVRSRVAMALLRIL